jgi:hypothetical protein
MPGSHRRTSPSAAIRDLEKLLAGSALELMINQYLAIADPTLDHAPSRGPA